jgi:hypothetical protein
MTSPYPTRHLDLLLKVIVLGARSAAAFRPREVRLGAGQREEGQGDQLVDRRTHKIGQAERQRIGVAADGSAPLGNLGHGIRVWRGAGTNLIGTNGKNVADETEGNVIA